MNRTGTSRSSDHAIMSKHALRPSGARVPTDAAVRGRGRAMRRHAWVLLVFAGSLLHSPSGARAQSTGIVRLFIDPGQDFEFVLDHKYRMQQREVKLAEGPHHFTFWAPKHRMVDTTLTVVPNTVSTFTLRLPLSIEYTLWENDLSHYKQQVVLARGGFMAATVGFGAWTAINFFQYKKAKDQLQDDEALYSLLSSPRAITEMKEVTLPADKDEFRKQRTELYIGGGLTLVAAGMTWWMFEKTRDRSIPQFEDKEKIKFDGLVWLPSPHGDTWLAGLTIPLR